MILNVPRIDDGLHELVLRLANNHDTTTPPAGWEAYEWAFVKGIASGQILQLCQQLVAPLREARPQPRSTP